MTETSQEITGDLMQHAGEPKRVCKKICGSIGCKRDILTQQCVGIMPDRCLSAHAKSDVDLAQATRWIHGNEGDMTWLVKSDSRFTHVGSTPERRNVTRIKTVEIRDNDTSHLSDVRYLRNFAACNGFTQN